MTESNSKVALYIKRLGDLLARNVSRLLPTSVYSPRLLPIISTSAECLRWSCSTHRYKIPGLCHWHSRPTPPPNDDSDVYHTSRSPPGDNDTITRLPKCSRRWAHLTGTSTDYAQVAQWTYSSPYDYSDATHTSVTPERHLCHHSTPLRCGSGSARDNIPGVPIGTVADSAPSASDVDTSSRSHLQATTEASTIRRLLPNRHWIPPATGLCIRRRSPRRWPCQCHHIVTTPSSGPLLRPLLGCHSRPPRQAPCTFPTCGHASATA